MNTLSNECVKIIESPKFKKKICIFVGNWNVEQCHENPHSLYIFGDNDVEKGCGGQAIIRKCKNSIGIPTKKYPNNNKTSFYTDEEYDFNCKKILAAIEKIIKDSLKYDELIFPKNGFGTGFAKLDKFAPQTLKFLDQLIMDCFGIDYCVIRKNGLQIEMNNMPI